VLQNPNVTTAIPGMTTFDQLADNAAVNQDLAFTEEERKALVQGEAQGGLYCNACERCVPGCSKNLPIPELMRAYMYAYGTEVRPSAGSWLPSMAFNPTPVQTAGPARPTASKDLT